LLSAETTIEDLTPANRTPRLDQAELDALLEPELQSAISALDGIAPLLGGMARYHLGLVDAEFQAIASDGALKGKRIRPGIALLSCAAAGGDPAKAAPLAAALELLHNFTLVHDDLQDESPSRRHRPTVWKLWGIGQAINAGDALFAAAQLALLRSRELGLDAGVMLRLSDAFNRMTIEIVEGQVLDLSFEGREDVRASDYLSMIAGKTSAIVRFAAWGGAIVAGASDKAADLFAEFGLALGLGFQIRDDLLGIWGATSTTGKAEADDIRRRKQSLPILMLRERVTPQEAAELQRLYDQPEITVQGISRVLELLDRYQVRTDIEQQIAAYHDAAQNHLTAATGNGNNPGRDALQDLTEALSSRTN
jgi:geranylgeranyl diphosphate synthase type I